ncbi:MAG TPA: DUF4836 family protein [Bacteroidales bacterium]|nr:DUF4836 family protein [Bacteroidales bacterium]
MKKIKFSLPLLALAGVIMLFSSCSKNSATHIPKDAFAVMVVDGSEFTKFSDPEFIQENPEFKDAMKEIEKESKKAAELVEKVMKDPDATGILLTEKSYAFAVMDKENVIFGVILPINKKKLEENLDMIADEFKLPVSTFIKEKNDIKYMEPESGIIFGWNKDVIMLVVNEASDDNFALLEKYMNLKEKESIMSDKDFKKFHKNCKAFNIWISSNVINQIDLQKESIKEFEKLTGIELAGNYGHIYLDIQKDEITYTSTLKFNKSIQNLDKKKLLENAEEIAELFEPLLDELDIFGDRHYNDDEFEDSEYDEEYPEMTDEELEALFKEYEDQLEEIE